MTQPLSPSFPVLPAELRHNSGTLACAVASVCWRVSSSRHCCYSYLSSIVWDAPGRALHPVGARLISVRSVVRVHPGPLDTTAIPVWCYNTRRGSSFAGARRMVSIRRLRCRLIPANPDLFSIRCQQSRGLSLKSWLGVGTSLGSRRQGPQLPNEPSRGSPLCQYG